MKLPFNNLFMRFQKKVNPRSQARIISGFRSFFVYLIFENYRETNPTDLIEAPKIGRKLPDTLSEYEINELISAVDLSHPQGERNRTILETLHSCGLRVSELITLKISDLFFDEGFIKVKYTYKVLKTLQEKNRRF
jgi:integrase/recombinase XerD